MSAPHTHGDSAHDLPGHGHGHDHAHGEGPAHGTRTSYLIGFGLSVVLTVIPFWLVMTGALGSMAATAVIIFGLALVQIVVHVVYFLHLDTKAEGGWNLMAFLFTVVVLSITIGGSTWVMFHLNSNMMPAAMPNAGAFGS